MDIQELNFIDSKATLNIGDSIISITNINDLYQITINDNYNCKLVNKEGLKSFLNVFKSSNIYSVGSYSLDYETSELLNTITNETTKLCSKTKKLFRFFSKNLNTDIKISTIAIDILEYTRASYFNRKSTIYNTIILMKELEADPRISLEIKKETIKIKYKNGK